MLQVHRNGVQLVELSGKLVKYVQNVNACYKDNKILSEMFHGHQPVNLTPIRKTCFRPGQIDY